MNKIDQWFHMLCFSVNPLPWYLTVLKYMLSAVLLVAGILYNKQHK